MSFGLNLTLKRQYHFLSPTLPPHWVLPWMSVHPFVYHKFVPTQLTTNSWRDFQATLCNCSPDWNNAQNVWVIDLSSMSRLHLWLKVIALSCVFNHPSIPAEILRENTQVFFIKNNCLVDIVFHLSKKQETSPSIFLDWRN